MNNELTHHGVMGMKWGHHKAQAEGLKTFKEHDYAKDTAKKIKINSDGSKTIPSGFTFNRVGKSSLDINGSGALYVSHGKEDAARYVKSLGPTTLGKLLGTASYNIQHIQTKSSLKMPSDSHTATETAKLLLSNKNLLNGFNKSIYSAAYTKSFDKDVSIDDIKKALKNPLGKEGQTLSYAVSSFLGDPNHSSESKIVYDHFRKQGYDAIPDVHDRLSGTSNTAMIVINPNKLQMTSTTLITKETLKSGKKYVKSIGALKASDLIQ